MAGHALRILGVFLPAVPHGRLQRLLLAVKVGELVEDDGDGQRHNQDAPQDAARGSQLARHGDGHHVAVAHGGHADRAPPPARWDGVKADVFLLLGSVGHAREDGDPHGQVEQQDPHLPVAVLEGKAEWRSVGASAPIMARTLAPCSANTALRADSLHASVGDLDASIHLCLGMSRCRAGLGWVGGCMGDPHLERVGQPRNQPWHPQPPLCSPPGCEEEAVPGGKGEPVFPSQGPQAEATPLPPALTPT